METQNKYLKRQNYNTLAMKHREGNGNPLQYSGLENLMEGGAWQAAGHGESQGMGSLVGCRLWGDTELDTPEVTQL